MIDMGTNTLNVEARSQSDGIRTTLESKMQTTQPIGMNKQNQFLNMNISISEYGSGTLRGSHVRPQGLGMQENSAIPQLDGWPSIPSRNQGRVTANIRVEQDYPCDGTYLQGTSRSSRRECLEDSSDHNQSYRS